MELKGAQKAVDNWIKAHGVRYFNELTNMAQLAEEVGENNGRWVRTEEASAITETWMLEEEQSGSVA